jgi:serine/threonine-protein kinase
LYEELTGRSPFDGATVPMICANVLAMAPAPLGVEGLPDGLERVVLRCLEKDPTKRYRDVGHLARALAPFAPVQDKRSVERISLLKDADGAPAISPASMAPPPNREGAATITSWGTKGQPTPRNKKVLPIAIAAGACALILGAVGVRALMTPDAPPPEPAATAPAPTAAAPADPAATHETAVPVVSAEPTASASVEATASAPAASAAASASAAPTIRPHNWGKTAPKGRTSGFGGRE